MMLVKAFATVSTTSGGGVAGDFAPSLFTGCIAGCFFAFAVNTLPGIALPVGYFAFFGMAAVIAATQRAPLMAISHGGDGGCIHVAVAGNDCGNGVIFRVPSWRAPLRDFQSYPAFGSE